MIACQKEISNIQIKNEKHHNDAQCDDWILRTLFHENKTPDPDCFKME